MTIKKLCKKIQGCKDCPFNVVCTENAIRDEEPAQLDTDDDLKVTYSILETARALQESDKNSKTTEIFNELTERNRKLKRYIECLKCEVSGHVCTDSCPVQYEAGTVGSVIENLETLSKVIDTISIMIK